MFNSVLFQAVLSYFPAKKARNRCRFNANVSGLREVNIQNHQKILRIWHTDYRVTLRTTYLVLHLICNTQKKLTFWGKKILLNGSFVYSARKRKPTVCVQQTKNALARHNRRFRISSMVLRIGARNEVSMGPELLRR